MNFFWSPSPTKRSTKSPRKIRGKFGAKFGAKFGTKIRKIRETLVLQLSCPNITPLVWGRRKTPITHKTHEHFSDGPCQTIVPGTITNPHPSQGQTGQNGDFTAEFNRERPVCPGKGPGLSQGRVPVCPRNGSCLSRTQSRPKCLCLLVFLA